MSIFQKNVDMINKHNAKPNKSYTLGVNEFTDMTYEELKAKYLVDFSKL